MIGRRVAAAAALALFLAAVVVGLVEIVRDFRRSLVVAALLVAGAAAAWGAIRRRGSVRFILLVIAALLVVAAVGVVVTGQRVGVGLVAVALLLASVGSASRVFRTRVVLPSARPPEHAIVVWNPRSGGWQGRQQQPARGGTRAWHRAD
jgi:hypothetical protein